MALAKHYEEIRIRFEESTEAITSRKSDAASYSWKSSTDLYESESHPGIYYPTCKATWYQPVHPYPPQKQAEPVIKKKKRRRSKQKKAQITVATAV